jgi:HSP20 family protein
MALLMKPEPFSTEFDRLVDSLFQPLRGNDRLQRWVPAMDLVEAGDHFVLKADLPGLSEDDVQIEVQDGVLTLSGERRSEHERTERGWHRVERSFGRFSRSLTLPEGVNAEAIAASFDKGVLEIRIPKPEERKPRRISIGVGGKGQKPETLEGTASEK